MTKEITKEQLIFSINSLLSSTSVSLRARSLPEKTLMEVKEKGVILLEKIKSNQIALEKAIQEFNTLVDLLNGEMDTTTMVGYPHFIEAPIVNHVKANIISFEFFLSQKLLSREMTLEQEEPLFDQCLELWKKVGLQVTPREAMMFLSRIIQKGNEYTPQEKFPLPDDTQY